MSTSHYTCHRCGARFGVAGDPDPYTEADYEADEHYDREVEWHESGECSLAPDETRVDVSAHVGDGAAYTPYRHVLDGEAFASLALSTVATLYLHSPEQAERLAQALLDAANLLRPAEDPPVTAQRIEDVTGPYHGGVVARHPAEVPAVTA